jgi:hypothetical protein
MFTIFRKLTGAAIVASLVFASSSALASGSNIYKVTITNITHSITFTPILVASHRKKASIFKLGEPASDALAEIAESGSPASLAALLETDYHATVENSGGLLLPGDSITVEVSAAHGARRITLASMMLPTNDGFIALNSVKAPKRGTVTYYSPGYDAGTESNDELCENIPGPTCGGAGRSGPEQNEVDTDEGYVQIHRGIHGIGINAISGLVDLAADVYDWRNPVAKITITRIRGYGDDDDDDEDDD